MFCSNCGCEIDSDSIFCVKCGAKVIDEPVEKNDDNCYLGKNDNAVLSEVIKKADENNCSNKNKNIILVVAMVICLIFTYVVATKTVVCTECGKNTSKVYYGIDGKSNPYTQMCEECGKEYWIGWGGDLDNVSENVDSTARNVLMVIEIIAFAIALFYINK